MFMEDLEKSQVKEDFRERLAKSLKSKRNQKEKTSIVGLATIVYDIITNIKWKEVSVVFIVDVIIMSFMYVLNAEIKTKEILNVSISLLGFQLTAYAILFSLGGINKRLLMKATDGCRPFEVIHATFVFGIIINITLLGLAMLQVKTSCPDNSICLFLVIFSLLWTVNTVFHLYATRTFLGNKPDDSI